MTNHLPGGPAALLVIDVQVGSFLEPTRKHDASGVIDRINDVARAVRRAGGVVLFIQHDGPSGDAFEPGSDAWQLLPSLERGETDLVVRKQACDAFYETGLNALLRERRCQRLLVSGSATEYCVDTTVRAAASLDFDVTVVADGHTPNDRAHLDAASIITHHNTTWRDLILPLRTVRVMPADEVIAELTE